MGFLIYTLGCKVNTYESNVIRDILLNNGYTEVDKNASICIINTCTVTNTAHQKSLPARADRVRRQADRPCAHRGSGGRGA